MVETEAVRGPSIPFRIVLPALVLLDLLLATAGVVLYPPVWGQRGFLRFVLELACALLAYGMLLVTVDRRRGGQWDEARRIAWRYGLGTGILEVLNTVLEDRAPGLSGPRISVGFMLVVFLLWGVAGWQAVRDLASMRMALITAAMAAGICMLVGVGGGFVVELFVLPPDAGAVGLWPEFKRSGWTDTRAFAVANTLESGFTHLLSAPIVALLFGAGGAGLAKLGAKRATV